MAETWTVGGRKLNLAKLVEMRRRSRIDRARQLAGNIETQAQILRSTQIYNLEAARLQLERQLGGVGRNVPVVAKTVHDVQLEMMTNEEAKLRRRQGESADIMAATWPTARSAPRPGSRKARSMVGQQTLDAFT